MGQVKHRKHINPCGAANVVKFIHDHVEDAKTLAKSLRVDYTFILGMSGWESGWGANRFAVEGNNYFSLHGGANAPYANGSMKAIGANLTLSTFPSYLDSGRSFIDQFGKFAGGTKTPEAFARALMKSGFNTGNARTGGNDSFLDDTLTGIDMVQKRHAC